MKLYTESMQFNVAVPTHQEPVSAAKLAELNQTSLDENKTSVKPQSDQVNISEEARQKNHAAMRKMLGKEEVDKTEAGGEETLDEKIAEFQEKITKLIAAIAQERRSGNDEKVKTMESELVMLNAQMLQLMEQKMEAAKS